MRVYTAIDRDEYLVIYDDGVQLEFTGRRLAVWGMWLRREGESVDFEKARALYEQDQRDNSAGETMGLALSVSRSFKPRNKFLG